MALIRLSSKKGSAKLLASQPTKMPEPSIRSVGKDICRVRRSFTNLNNRHRNPRLLVFKDGFRIGISEVAVGYPRCDADRGSGDRGGAGSWSSRRAQPNSRESATSAG